MLRKRTILWRLGLFPILIGCNKPVDLQFIKSNQRRLSGWNHSLLLAESGRAYAWGRNDSGQNANQTFTSSHIPTLVGGIRKLLGMSAGEKHSVFLRIDKIVETAGDPDSVNALGDGTTSVRALTGVVPTLSDINGISAGAGFTLAIDSSGVVYGWGRNSDGQLTTLANGASPTAIALSMPAIAVSAGTRHSLFVLNDETVVASGANESGALGDGTTTSSTSPVPVRNLAGITAVAAGNGFSLALGRSGRVWAWGDSSEGQVGNGSLSPSLTPTLVDGVSGIILVVACGKSAFALNANGEVFAWGANSNGQFGNGTTTGSSLPVRVSGIQNVQDMACGQNHLIIAKGDGLVQATGDNAFGQSGFPEGGVSPTFRTLTTITY